LVIIFAKAPRLGRVKTRLARGIGALPALRFFRSTLASTYRRLAADRRWQTQIAVTPDQARRGWPRGACVIAQGHGDLGQRMWRALHDARRRPVAIVGCDIPDLAADHIATSLRLLASHDAVLGPARDGGYWLIGMRGFVPSPRLFEGVRWSSKHALADTRARLAGWRVALGPTLDDVDEAADLARLRPLPSV
jgi:rSAM/selenodomain-associated transferase 1